MLEQGPDRRESAERRFYGVVIASLMLHAAAFALCAWYGNRPAGDPPRLIMVDMATLPLPEPKAVEVATPPEPLRPPPRAQAPSPAVPPPAVVSRPVAAPPVNTPPVPVAAIGETAGSTSPATTSQMSVPVSPPVARKIAESAPAAPAAVQASPADGAEKLAGARAAYKATIAALIDRNKEYPLFARKAGQQGTCSVRCTMTCGGEILRVELVKSSGSGALDKAGIRAVQNVGKFPPPPTDGRCTEVSFEVPITFRLG